MNWKEQSLRGPDQGGVPTTPTSFANPPTPPISFANPTSFTNTSYSSSSTDAEPRTSSSSSISGTPSLRANTGSDHFTLADPISTRAALDPLQLSARSEEEAGLCASASFSDPSGREYLFFLLFQASLCC